MGPVSMILYHLAWESVVILTDGEASFLSLISRAIFKSIEHLIIVSHIYVCLTELCISDKLCRINNFNGFRYR